MFAAPERVQGSLASNRTSDSTPEVLMDSYNSPCLRRGSRDCEPGIRLASLPDPNCQPLQVASLGERQCHRMIRRLAQPFDNVRLDAGVKGCIGDNLLAQLR